MSNANFIAGEVDRLVRKHGTRDPTELCAALDIHIHYKDLGNDLKAYYCEISRIKNIVINNRIVDVFRRILISHELGHAVLGHIVKNDSLAMMRDMEFFENTGHTEYEANLFAAELLIEDEELLASINVEDKSFFGVASEFGVPFELLDFKIRMLKAKGYRMEPVLYARSDFLGNAMDGIYEPAVYDAP